MIFKKYIFAVAMAFLFVGSSQAQQHTFFSKSELGVMFGGSYYVGDLNPLGHFKNTNFSGGAIFRHNVNSRFVIRATGTYAKVEGYDSQAKTDYQKNRNLSFQSTIFEGAAGFEFNYHSYMIGNQDYPATTYMFFELGVAKINPKGEINGDLVELQPLGTEGQGSTLSTRGNYSLTQLVIPFGLGFKCNLGKRAAFSVEYGIRKTFTDYLDDVSGNYVDNVLLAQENGPLAASAADRSLGDNRAVGPRGNNSTKDWYSTFHAMITFKLGKKNVCWGFNK